MLFRSLADLKAGTLTSISGGTLRALTKELIFNTDSAAQRLTITSYIDGSQSLTKTGEGTLVLRADRLSNDFTGPVQIQAGGIELSRTGRGSFAIGDSAPVYFSNQDGASLSLLSDGPVLQSISLTGGNLTSGIPTVTVASTAGLVAGVAVTGTGIPAGATVLSVDSATQFTLNVPATSTTSGQTIVVACTAIGSKQVYLASTAGLAPGMSISAPGVYPGSVIVSIDTANRITMDRASYTDAISATTFQFGTTYSETIGSIAGGNRQTNANFAYINLGVGTTLNINQTTASTFTGEFTGLGSVRLAGNATLTLNNYHTSFGNLIVDRGVINLTGTSGVLYGTLPAGNVPDIIINRYGALYLDKAYTSGGGVNQINNAVAIHLNSAAGTMASTVTGDKYPETRPIGLWNRGNQAAAGVETIMGLYFDSGNSYVGGYPSGSMSQGLVTSTGTFLRNNFATSNIRARYAGAKGTGGSDSIYVLSIGDAALKSSFVSTLLGGGSTMVAAAQMGTTLNSTNVTWSTMTGVSVGMGVGGQNILPSTTVTAVGSGQFTMSQVSIQTSTANWVNIYAAKIGRAHV